MPSVPLALGPIRWPNSSKAGALSLNLYSSVGNLNEIVIVIVVLSEHSLPIHLMSGAINPVRDV